MHMALRAVHATRGHTWPNPTVGCVLVDPATDKIIATGCTCKGGRPHAETEALDKAGALAKGAHAYVTLEPCNHTSPHKPVSCTDALINAGVSTVIIALPDPDPRMAGLSIAKLRAAGIDVHAGLEAANAYHAIRGHIMRTLFNRPYITLKLAQSADGMLGLPNTRTPISCEQSWQRTYIQRGKVDAVMIGINTDLADNPQLTNRNADATHQPVRIILDTHARLPLDGLLAQTARQTPVWLVTSATNTASLENAGIRILKSAMDITAVIDTLYKEGLGHILVEGGSRLAQSLITADLVDEALIIKAPLQIGPEGIPAPPPPNIRPHKTHKTPTPPFKTCVIATPMQSAQTNGLFTIRMHHWKPRESFCLIISSLGILFNFDFQLYLLSTCCLDFKN